MNVVPPMDGKPKGARRSNIWEAVDALNARHTREQARGVVVVEASRLADPDFAAFMRRLTSALSCSRDDSLAAQYWFTLGDLAAAAPVAVRPWLEPLAALAFQHLRVAEGYESCIHFLASIAANGGVWTPERLMEALVLPCLALWDLGAPSGLQLRGVSALSAILQRCDDPVLDSRADVIIERALAYAMECPDSVRRAHAFNCLRVCGKTFCGWHSHATALLATCLRALQEFCRPLTDKPTRCVPQEKFAVVAAIREWAMAQQKELAGTPRHPSAAEASQRRMWDVGLKCVLVLARYDQSDRVRRLAYHSGLAIQDLLRSTDHWDLFAPRTTPEVVVVAGRGEGFVEPRGAEGGLGQGAYADQGHEEGASGRGATVRAVVRAGPRTTTSPARARPKSAVSALRAVVSAHRMLAVPGTAHAGCEGGEAMEGTEEAPNVRRAAPPLPSSADPSPAVTAGTQTSPRWLDVGKGVVKSTPGTSGVQSSVGPYRTHAAAGSTWREPERAAWAVPAGHWAHSPSTSLGPAGASLPPASAAPASGVSNTPPTATVPPAPARVFTDDSGRLLDAIQRSHESCRMGVHAGLPPCLRSALADIEPSSLSALVPSTLPDLLFRLILPLLRPHLETIATRAPVAVLAHAQGEPPPPVGPLGPGPGLGEEGDSGSLSPVVDPGVRVPPGPGSLMPGASAVNTHPGPDPGPPLAPPAAQMSSRTCAPPLAATIEACVRDWEAFLPWLGELTRLAPLPKPAPPHGRSSQPPSRAAASGTQGLDSFTGAHSGDRARSVSQGQGSGSAGGVVGVVRAARRGPTWRPWDSAAVAAAAAGYPPPEPYPLLADGTHAEVGRVVAAAAAAFGLCTYRPEALEVSKRLEARVVAVQRALVSHVL